MSAIDDYKLGYVNSGDNIRGVARASRMNAIQNLSKETSFGQPYSRSGSALRMIGPGWVINRQRRGIVRGGAQSFPWQISIVTETDAMFTKVRPGTINSLIPSNMFDRWEISTGSTFYVTLDCTTDGYNVTSARIDGNSTVPADVIGVNLNIAPIEFSIPLGIVIGGKTFQLVTRLLTVTPAKVVQTLTSNPQPGRPYYDFMYTWTVTSF